MKSTSTRRGKINFTKMVEFKWRLAIQNIPKIFALRQTVSQLRFDSILQDKVPTYQSKNSFDKTTHISKVCCLCVFATVIPEIKNNKNWLSTCQRSHSCQLIDIWLLTIRTIWSVLRLHRFFPHKKTPEQRLQKFNTDDMSLPRSR